MSEPRHVYQLFIRTTPERLWDAITSDAAARKVFRCVLESDWRVGSVYRYTKLDGSPAHFGRLLEVDPPRRLVQTFEHEPGVDHGSASDEVSKVTWEIEASGPDLCKLTVIHDGWSSESDVFRNAGRGWPRILSSLKSLLETGEALSFT